MDRFLGFIVATLLGVSAVVLFSCSSPPQVDVEATVEARVKIAKLEATAQAVSVEATVEARLKEDLAREIVDPPTPTPLPLPPTPVSVEIIIPDAQTLFKRSKDSMNSIKGYKYKGFQKLVFLDDSDSEIDKFEITLEGEYQSPGRIREKVDDEEMITLDGIVYTYVGGYGDFWDIVDDEDTSFPTFWDDQDGNENLFDIPLSGEVVLENLDGFDRYHYVWSQARGTSGFDIAGLLGADETDFKNRDVKNLEIGYWFDSENFSVIKNTLDFVFFPEDWDDISKVSYSYEVDLSYGSPGDRIVAPAPANIRSPNAAPVAAPAPAPSVAAVPAAATKVAPAGKTTNVYGRAMPSDAAPMADQFLKINYEKEGEALEFPVSVYNSAAGGIQSGFGLTLLSTDLTALPGGATDWSSSPDMKTWTFNIDPDLTWSDGVPVTAHDYVYTWQYYADPDHSYDFTWYFGMLGVENYNAIEFGEKPLDSLGVTASEDKTLVFQLDAPAPYVPSFMMYSSPLAKHVAEKHGPYYSNDPRTAVSSTPWILKEWIPNQHAEFEPNLNYTGKLLPYIENFKAVRGERKFDAYLAGEVDSINGPFTPADQEYLMNDAGLMKERGLSPADFRTHYLFFDFQSEPFDDVRVRQAFAKAIDREAIMKQIVGESVGEPRYGMIIPGFPDAAGPGKLKQYQGFDVAAAQKLMAEAGYAGGAGFPKLEMALRQETELFQAIAAHVAWQLEANLGIDVTVNNMNRRSYMGALNYHELKFAMVSYGFDYVDASNFMGIFKTDGRHNWNNKEFENLRIEAGEMALSDERSAKMVRLQEILSENVGSVFLWSEIQNQLHKPYLKGTWRETNEAGWAGLQLPNWNPGFGAQNIYEVYVGENVNEYARSAY